MPVAARELAREPPGEGRVEGARARAARSWLLVARGLRSIEVGGAARALSFASGGGGGSRGASRARSMSAGRAKKVKMATKSCPECDQQVRPAVQCSAMQRRETGSLHLALVATGDQRR